MIAGDAGNIPGVPIFKNLSVGVKFYILCVCGIRKAIAS